MLNNSSQIKSTKSKQIYYSLIIRGCMNVYQGILEYTSLRIFIDSRFISIIVNRQMTKKGNNFIPINSTKWSTQEGKFMTN